MNISSFDIYLAASEWALTAPKNGTGTNLTWLAAYLPREKEHCVYMVISFTLYEEGETKSDTHRRRVTWDTVRKLMDEHDGDISRCLNAELCELFDYCGIEPPSELS